MKAQVRSMFPHEEPAKVTNAAMLSELDAYEPTSCDHDWRVLTYPFGNYRAYGCLRCHVEVWMSRKETDDERESTRAATAAGTGTGATAGAQTAEGDDAEPGAGVDARSGH